MQYKLRYRYPILQSFLRPIFYLSVFLLATLGILSCSNEADIPPPQPQQPSNISALARDGYVVLNWPVVQYAQSYNIYYDTQQIVSLAQSKRLTTQQPLFTHTGLINNTTFYYVITAVNTTGVSSPSLETFATPINLPGTDPLFMNQWNLENTGQVSGGVPGEDINLKPLINTCTTQNNCRGEGVLVAIVDDGLEIGHEDLFANIATNMSFNYLNNSTDPSPIGPDWAMHGTSVAGIVAARDNNGVGLRGIAPRASLAGYNFLQKGDTNTAFDALTHDANNDRLPDADVSVNSWGPPDNGELNAAEMEVTTALTVGVQKGRNGLGTVYVWAAGNGATGAGLKIDSTATGECNRSVDNSNYDGYANNRRVMAVGAVTQSGIKSSYSECGANIWVSAPSGEFCNASGNFTITSTDLSGNVGYNTNQINNFKDYTDTNYTKCFNGTSAAAPTVAGVVALILQQTTKNLSWRDVRYIIASTARINDLSQGWTKNGAGMWVNHKYGFGVVDSEAAVALAVAPSYVVLGPEVQFSSELYSVQRDIPDYNPNNPLAGIKDSQSVSGSAISKIDYVEIILSTTHEYFADLEVVLTHTYSKVGQPDVSSNSRLAETHLIPCEREKSNCSTYTYNNWRFGSARHLGEPADGAWSLSIRDNKANLTGQFDSWKIKIYGS